MLTRAFKLRFQVYCLERGFLPAADFPSGHETDEHDDDAAHFGVFDDEEELVGYVRLVQPRDGGFPFKDHCTTLHNDARLPDPTEAAEISRLVVREDYRRGRRGCSPGRRHDDAEPSPDLQRRSASARILMHLYRQMYAYSVENNIRYWYAAMERSLARSLMYSNFAFRKIGPEADYFGPVAPYVAELRELEQSGIASNPQLWAWIMATEETPRNANEWQGRNLRSAVPRRASDAMPVVAPACATVNFMRARPTSSEPAAA